MLIVWTWRLVLGRRRPQCQKDSWTTACTWWPWTEKRWSSLSTPSKKKGVAWYDCDISYYQLPTDQWTIYQPSFCPKVPYDVKWLSRLRFVQGNTVLFINIEQGNQEHDSRPGYIHNRSKHDEACLQWRFSQDRENISEVSLPRCPTDTFRRFGVILSIWLICWRCVTWNNRSHYLCPESHYTPVEMVKLHHVQFLSSVTFSYTIKPHP